MSETNSELEAFRQKWREEVTARAQGSTKAPAQSTSKGFRKLSEIPVSPVNRSQKSRDNDEDAEPQILPGEIGRRLSDGEFTNSSSTRDREPQSALEHYEKAVEREDQGSLGDSLILYRKAFRVRLT
jgi:F-box protein 9